MIGQIDIYGNEQRREDMDPAELFRKNCEIAIVEHGTGFHNGKVRIVEYYKEGCLNEDVLKFEYGTGGSEVKLKDGSSALMMTFSDGIAFSGKFNTKFRWKEVLAVIKGAIYRGEYL